MVVTRRRSRIARQEPVGESTYQLLKDLVTGGQLADGERLREQDLSERFRVSRTPVREALKRLQAEGLVKDEPGRGLVVHSISLDDVIDTYVVLEAMQGLAARLLTERSSETDRLRLISTLDGCERALDSGDIERALEFDRQFETALRTLGHNGQIRRVIDLLHTSLQRLASRDAVTLERMRQRLMEHRQIVDAVAARDPGAAEEAARAHVKRARDYRVGMLIDAGIPTVGVSASAAPR